MRTLTRLHGLCLLLTLVGLLSLTPNLIRNHILEGQIIKQTFSAEMAQSFSRGDQTGIYPHRHFLEVFYPDVVPWAEEFPLYTGVIGYTVRWTGLPLVPLGRFVSFGFLILLLLGARRLGKNLDCEIKGLKSPLKLEWILPLICVWLPAFRTYGVSFMPDLPMTACCFWGALLAFEKKWRSAAAALCIAALFKYFAVFTTLGVMGYIWTQEKGWRALKHSALIALSTLPAVAYMGLFLLIRIPNPITEYRTINGHGHMASLEMLTSIGTYLRFCTWMLVKNPSVPGTALAVLGLIWFWKKKPKALKTFVASLAAALLLFPLIMTHGFYVHDYYGLQFTILTAIFAALGIMSLSRLPLVACLGVVLMTTGFVMTRSNLIPQTHYLKAAELMKSWTKPEDRGLLISSLSPAVLLFQTGQTAWGFEPKDWNRLGSDVMRLLQDERIKWVAVYLVDPWAVSEWGWISDELSRAGWRKIQAKQTLSSTNFKVPTTRLWLLQRN